MTMHADFPAGSVWLVGAGPGDMELLTLKALRLIQQAEVVVYDRLVAKAVLDMTRRDAQRIYVGKERDNHAMRQEEINELLARLALPFPSSCCCCCGCCAWGCWCKWAGSGWCGGRWAGPLPGLGELLRLV